MHCLTIKTILKLNDFFFFVSNIEWLLIILPLNTTGIPSQI